MSDYQTKINDPVKYAAILAAMNKWQAAEDKIPQHDHQKGYKSRTKTAQKLWREFTALLQPYEIEPVKFVHSFQSFTNFKVSLIHKD